MSRTQGTTAKDVGERGVGWSCMVVVAAVVHRAVLRQEADCGDECNWGRPVALAALTFKACSPASSAPVRMNIDVMAPDVDAPLVASRSTQTDRLQELCTSGMQPTCVRLHEQIWKMPGWRCSVLR